MHDDATILLLRYLLYMYFYVKLGGETQFEMLGKVWLGKGPSG